MMGVYCVGSSVPEFRLDARGGKTSERDDVLLGADGAQCTAYGRTTKGVRVASGL